MSTPVFHMLCGKIASGKSTLTAELGRQEHTVVISEDVWLAALHGSEMATISDYVRCAARLRAAMGPHVTDLLNTGVSVVLDFPANTLETRGWMRGILEETGVTHQLHLLYVPDEICIARLHARNAGGDHPFAATEAQFHQISKHFVPPSEEEGFNIVRHGPEGQSVRP